MATIFPPYITAMRSDSARISESSALTSRIPVPRVARRAEARVNELDRADVHAARGLRRDEHEVRSRELRAR